MSLARIDRESSGRTPLIEETGGGKWALLARLTVVLQAQSTLVFTTKADLLSLEVSDLARLSGIPGLEGVSMPRSLCLRSD